jgi:hypothetical protein
MWQMKSLAHQAKLIGNLEPWRCECLVRSLSLHGKVDELENEIYEMGRHHYPKPPKAQTAAAATAAKQATLFAPLGLLW